MSISRSITNHVMDYSVMHDNVSEFHKELICCHNLWVGRRVQDGYWQNSVVLVTTLYLIVLHSRHGRSWLNHKAGENVQPLYA